VDLFSGNHRVETIFELIGSNENAMTSSLGWVLLKCPALLQSFVAHIVPHFTLSSDTKIYLQRYSSHAGFTDIEIIDGDGLHVIIEAKKGFIIPEDEQLSKYAERLNSTKAKNKILVVLAENDRKDIWLASNLKSQINNIPVESISWRSLQEMCRSRESKESSNNAQKRLLQQFDGYIGKVSSMRDLTSNSVYIVSLGSRVFFESDITQDGKAVSFIDVVERFNKYFHPIGGGPSGWPVNPPNYIAFRYKSILQSIHHIKAYHRTEDFSEWFPLKSIPEADYPSYLYELGPAIRPLHEVRTNDREKRFPAITMASRRWADLDLLLTSKSVAEAVAKTSDRHR